MAQFDDCNFEYGSTVHITRYGLGGGSCYFKGNSGDVISVTLHCLILDNCGYLRLFTPENEIYESPDGYTFTGLVLPETGEYTINYGYDFGTAQDYYVDEDGLGAYGDVKQEGELTIFLELAKSGKTGEEFNTTRIVNKAVPNGTSDLCNRSNQLFVQLEINDLHIRDAQEGDSELFGGTEGSWLTYGIGLGPNAQSLEFGEGDIYYNQWNGELRPDTHQTNFMPLNRKLACDEIAYIYIATFEEDNSLLGGTSYDNLGTPWILPIQLNKSGINTYPERMELSFSGVTSYGTYDYRVTYTVRISDTEVPLAVLPGSLATANLQVIYWAVHWNEPTEEEIYWMDGGLNGKPQPLFQDSGMRQAPDLAPDGTRLLYTSDQDAGVSNGQTTIDIYMMNIDGTGRKRLTDFGGRTWWPRWSPDGKHIVFILTEMGEANQYDIFVMDADGSNVKQLTDTDVSESFPDWSPNGDKIVFSSGDVNEHVIKIMDADGSNVQQLTSGGQHMYDDAPNWSPDGSKIAFASNRDQYDANNVFEIYVMDVDGANQTRLTTNLANDYLPVWSPDGSQIAFTSWARRQPGKIMVMNADGSDPVLLLSNSVQNIQQISWIKTN